MINVLQIDNKLFINEKEIEKMEANYEKNN